MQWLVKVAGRNLKGIACAWIGLSILLLVAFVALGVLFPGLDAHVNASLAPVLTVLKAAQDALFYFMIFGAVVRIADFGSDIADRA